MERFEKQHDDLVRRAEHILAFALSSALGDAKELSEMRRAFSKAIVSHREEEKTHVLNAIRMGRLAERTAADMGNKVIRWQADFMTCNSVWPTARIMAEPCVFADCFKPIVEEMRRLTRMEEEQVLAPIAMAEARPPKASTHKF
ncbi:hypothetical protein [Sphingomonas morindae]|uniref:Hemerythrin-like domain-containing protein n=1 Tax=Sphingomonas morindae TaxID=1541170 RepID=A0ABY4XA18_9SPHN|nr:hypothetical protein [Sphingomonas morindae]USI73526.1 hypothetical protein LHA26_03325 [Sphingomonas morindae]